MVEPRVTLILAIRNEAAHIAACLQSVLDQDYPADRLEIIVVDGDSTDDTVETVRGTDASGRVNVLGNPQQAMPFGLNLALEHATGEFIGSVIGHSTLPPDYVRRCVEAMGRTDAWAVGGRYVRRGTTPVQRAIALVTSHPLGVGDSRHNFGTTAGWVETAFPGFWRREAFERVGSFDPTMVVNEDNELALRIRKAGGRIWYEPSIGVEYTPRSSLGAFFTQYRRYAVGKIAVLRKHGSGLSWRHAIPAAWVAWLVAGPLAALVTPAAGWIWLAGLATYSTAVVVTALRLAERGTSWWRIAVAFVTIHLAYGIGLWQGLFRWVVRR